MRISPLDALFPKTRQALLAALFLHPEEWRYLSELAKRLRVPPSSLQRELASLVAADLLVRREDNNRVYYRANPDCPIIAELQAILVKTAGIADVIKASLKKFLDKIDIAFIYGSVARAEELSASDVDLLVIGDVRLGQLVPSLKRAEKSLEREVNPTIYSRSEFLQKLKKADSFLETVLSDSRIFLKGDDRELAALDR